MPNLSKTEKNHQGEKMLKDFSKIETFLTVVREKSFSRASKKLGISQPAVTQQIKLLEEYIESKIVDRKKNGTQLTKEGEAFLKIALKLEKFISATERELMGIINKKFTFNIGASNVIGNYILPEFLDEIKGTINNEVAIKIGSSNSIIESLRDKKVDLALIEKPAHFEDVYSREWLEDELVIIGGEHIPSSVRKENLHSFEWICRDDESSTRAVVREAFNDIGVDCSSFDINTTISDPTAIKNAMLKSNGKSVSVISKLMVEDEVAKGKLKVAKVRGLKLTRPLYIAYLKERKNDAFILSAVNYLASKK